MALFDEQGQRIRGLENKAAAELALARIQVAGSDQMEGGPVSHTEWLVAKVCSDYIQYCQRGVVSGSISKGHRDNTVAFLNDLCRFAGALPIKQLKKGHIKTWVEEHASWRSSVTQRSVISIVLAAFNRAEQMYDAPNPLKGLKKPASQPRLQSFSAEDEQLLYKACEPRFREFLFAAIHTGFRPYCELAVQFRP